MAIHGLAIFWLTAKDCFAIRTTIERTGESAVRRPVHSHLLACALTWRVSARQVVVGGGGSAMVGKKGNLLISVAFLEGSPGGSSVT